MTRRLELYETEDPRKTSFIGVVRRKWNVRLSRIHADDRNVIWAIDTLTRIFKIDVAESLRVLPPDKDDLLGAMGHTLNVIEYTRFPMNLTGPYALANGKRYEKTIRESIEVISKYNKLGKIVDEDCALKFRQRAKALEQRAIGSAYLKKLLTSPPHVVTEGPVYFSKS